MPEPEGPASRKTRVKREPESGQGAASGEKARPDQAGAAEELRQFRSGSDYSQAGFQRHTALLGGSRLSHPMYARQRAIMVQQLQRDYGNRYVQGLVEHISRKKAEAAQAERVAGPVEDAFEPEFSHHAPSDVMERALFTEGATGAANVPQKAKDVATGVTGSSTGTPTSIKVGKVTKTAFSIGGDQYIGGDPYGNRSGDLPATGAPYKEYDANPYTPGVNRGTERVVIGSDGKKYFTNNHYADFTEFS